MKEQMAQASQDQGIYFSFGNDHYKLNSLEEVGRIADEKNYWISSIDCLDAVLKGHGPRLPEGKIGEIRFAGDEGAYPITFFRADVYGSQKQSPLDPRMIVMSAPYAQLIAFPNELTEKLLQVFDTPEVSGDFQETGYSRFSPSLRLSRMAGQGICPPHAPELYNQFRPRGAGLIQDEIDEMIKPSAPRNQSGDRPAHTPRPAPAS